jgi:hypothetical protein
LIPAEGIGILTDALINALIVTSLIDEFIYAFIDTIQDIFIDMLMGIFNDASMKA